MKTNQNKVLTLPKSLIEDIEGLGLSKSNRNHTYKFINYLLKKSYKNSGNYMSYVQVPSAYLKKVYKGKYTQWFNVLKSNNIITTLTNSEGKSSYSNFDKKHSISYSINVKYMIGEDMGKVVYMCPLFDFDEEAVRINKLIKDDLMQLITNKDKMYQYVNEKMSTLSIDNFKTNEQIVDESFKVVIKEQQYASPEFYIKREDALLKIAGTDRMLIQDKRRFFIMNPNEFIAMKKQAFKMYYTHAIFKLDEQIFMGTRNETNNRLDHNITNLCKELTDMIVEDNNLVQLDLNNSQFAILSHILPSDLIGDDVELFKRLSFSGKLYGHIQSLLSLNTKKEAKQITFELLFSSYRNGNPMLKIIKQEFPTVIGWINDYKKTYGSEEFAIMLQKTESQMFIDDIWMSLKEDGYFAIPKHDSIICKAEDAAYVKEFIQLYFNSIGFEGRLSEDEPSTPEVIEVPLESICEANKTITQEEVESPLKIKMRERFESEFKYPLNSGARKITGGEFHTLTYNKFLDKLSFTQMFTAIKGLDNKNFELFWDKIQELKKDFF